MKMRIRMQIDIPSAITRDTYRHFIDFVAENPKLSETDKRKIFYDNAEQLYFAGTPGTEAL